MDYTQCSLYIQVGNLTRKDLQNSLLYMCKLHYHRLHYFHMGLDRKGYMTALDLAFQLFQNIEWMDHQYNEVYMYKSVYGFGFDILLMKTEEKIRTYYGTT